MGDGSLLCYENHTKHAVYQNAEFIQITAGGTAGL